MLDEKLLFRMHIFFYTGNFEERWKISFCNTISARHHGISSFPGYLQLWKASTVSTIIERTYSCLDYLQLSRTSSVVESTFSYRKYFQLSRAPPVLQGTSSCREHIQLSKVPPVVENTSSCREYLQLSRTPPVVENTSSCPKHLQLSKVPPVVESDFCQTGSVIVTKERHKDIFSYSGDGL